jgi:branched-chain amino acid transport system ATP-binding protein
MLAIARAIMSEPRMLLLDEPSEGIMRVLMDEMFALFRDIKAAGVTILLVEQNVEQALALADRAYIMDHGEIVHHDTAANLIADKEIQERYCSV